MFLGTTRSVACLLGQSWWTSVVPQIRAQETSTIALRLPPEPGGECGAPIFASYFKANEEALLFQNSGWA